jgi:replicative DNA helicase
MRRHGITTRRMQADIGMRYAGSALYRAAMSRERAARVAAAVPCPDLEALATSDVYWDAIASIVPDGIEEVFDLTVSELHNFVANDIVVHNSIEQDADLVAFIYRDEYYNEESESQGLAEVHLAKHRNGPTGTEKLSFLKRYAKFADLAAA